MKKFRPSLGYIEITPIIKDSILAEDSGFIDAGEIIAINEEDDQLCKAKVGDTIFFEAYGCYITSDQVDGQKHYLVPIDRRIIKGVYGE